MGVLRITYLAMQMVRIHQQTPAQVGALQDRRLRRLLRLAAARSPFYRERLRGLDLDHCALTDLPTVTKKEMMGRFDDFVTDRRLRKDEIRQWLADRSNLGRRYLDRFIVFQTSGTTGENALVIYDRRAMDFVHAAMMARHTMPEEPSFPEQVRLFLRLLFVQRERFASVLMAGGPYPAYTVALHSPPLHHLFVEQRVFPLREPLDQIVAGLNEYQPNSLVSYPSLLGMLAREQLAGRLRLNLNGEFSTLGAASEPLSPDVKRLAEAAWGRGVQDTYGTAECLALARSCKRFDRMHTMDDLCIVEVVDRQNRPVPAGQPGAKILLTNLFNRVQPFIRYEIGDVTGYSTEPCDCGWPFPTLLPVEGRTDDVFYVDRPGGGYEAVHPYLFLGPIVELTEVREYQLAQTARNEIVFYYVPADPEIDIEPRVWKVLNEGVDLARLHGRVSLRVQCVDRIPRDERSGKFRQIISRVGPPPDLDDSSRIAH